MAAARERVIAAGRRLVAHGQTPSLAAAAREAGLSRATAYRAAGSEAALLRLLDLTPDPSARDRILAAAAAMVGEVGLGRLSMEELAARSGVSRASLYRLFPGKEALFRELLRAFSPLEEVSRVVDELGQEPPEVVMPVVAATVAGTLAARTGILRSLFYEVTSLRPDTQEAVRYGLSRGLGSVLVYLAAQIQAGRLRPMHPVLALQAFAGPLLVHLMTRELAARVLGAELDPEASARTLADVWLAGMRPAPEAA